MGNYMEQLATGKKINRPSDDPFGTVKAMNYRSQLAEVDQYKRNINEVHHKMDNIDAALDETTKVLHRIRELAVYASNDTHDSEERSYIKKEVEQLREQLVKIANTNVNGEYIFNANDPTSKLIENGNYPSETDVSGTEIVISKGIKINTNVNAGAVFGTDTFERIDNFIQSLEPDDNQAAISASIEDIDHILKKVLNERADLGARMNRIDLIENRLGETEVLTTKMMAENENIDYEKVITQFMTQESVHRAALAASSRLIQPTLLDFLR